MAYVTRTKEQDAQKLISSDLAKIILCPRRARKSVFAYFNFDDESLPEEGKEKIADNFKKFI